MKIPSIKGISYKLVNIFNHVFVFMTDVSKFHNLSTDSPSWFSIMFKFLHILSLFLYKLNLILSIYLL